jgi:large subunit ribosomal protein L29
MTKYKDIQALTDEEIREKILVESEMLRKLKFSHAISPIENPNKIRETRRIIAQLKTEVGSRQLAKKES